MLQPIPSDFKTRVYDGVFNHNLFNKPQSSEPDLMQFMSQVIINNQLSITLKGVVNSCDISL